MGVGKDFSTSGRRSRRPSTPPHDAPQKPFFVRCWEEWSGHRVRVFVLQMLGHQSARNKELPQTDERRKRSSGRPRLGRAVPLLALKLQILMIHSTSGEFQTIVAHLLAGAPPWRVQPAVRNHGTIVCSPLLYLDSAVPGKALLDEDSSRIFKVCRERTLHVSSRPSSDESLTHSHFHVKLDAFHWARLVLNFLEELSLICKMLAFM